MIPQDRRPPHGGRRSFVMCGSGGPRAHDPPGQVDPAGVHAVDEQPLDPDLLVEDRGLQGRHQGGRQEGYVAGDAELAEQVAHVHGREGVRGVRAGAGAAGGADQVGVQEGGLEPGAAEGEQPIPGLRARAERRRAGTSPTPATRLGVVEQRRHQALAGLEPPEDGALADPGLGRERVHRQTVDAAVLDQPRRRLEQGRPVAGSVATLGGGLVERGGAGGVRRTWRRSL